MLHGIWAFKAHSPREQTDLILGEQVRIDEAERAAEAMVLTEWKVVKGHSDLQSTIEQAKSQAALYVAGSLAGFELATYRYLVMVSATRLLMPDDPVENGITYRLINIAVDPLSPSKEAAKAARRV